MLAVDIRLAKHYLLYPNPCPNKITYDAAGMRILSSLP